MRDIRALLARYNLQFSARLLEGRTFAAVRTQLSSVLNRNWPENLALGNYYVDLIAYFSKLRLQNQLADIANLFGQKVNSMVWKL